ncbi:MAG: GNAT family N-acetyltransferase [archaeon]
MEYTINPNPSEKEWKAALKDLKQEENFFIVQEDKDTSEMLNRTPVRILIYKKNKLACLYQGVVIIKKAGFIKLLNVRCGRREDRGIFINDPKNKKELLKILVKEIRSVLKKKFGFFSMLYLSFYFDKEEPLFSGWKHKYNHTPILDLSPSKEEIEAGLNRKNRNEIRQARKRGVKVKLMNNDAGLKVFYDLNKYYWEKLKKTFWLENKDLFLKFHERFMKKGCFYIFIAEVENKPAAFATIWAIGHDKVVYGNGGYNAKYQWYRPSNLVLWEAMLWAKDKGYRYFDMGGGVEDQKNLKKYNITKFKLGFGSQLNRFIKYYKIML